MWSTGDTTRSITVTKSGSYQVRGINTAGCTGMTSVPVNVFVESNFPDTPIITVSGSSHLCAPDSVVLIGPRTASGYLWSNGATGPSITVRTAGQYSLIVHNAGGCYSDSSAPVTVTVSSPPATPSVTAGGPLTFCQGGTVTLIAPAGFSYLWSNGAATRSISPDTSGVFTVKTIANGCTSAASTATTVTVKALPATPVITPGGSLTICQGGSVLLSAPAGYTYKWSNGATSQNLTATTPGNYSVQVISGGCTSSASAAVAVVVTPLPATPSITPSGPIHICGGDSVVLSAPAGYTYLWSTGDTTRTVTSRFGGAYRVRVLANGCTSAQSAIVTVSATIMSQPVVSPSGPQSICAGKTLTLTAPAGFSGYLWSNGATGQSITVSTPDSFNVRAISGACTSSASAAVQVTVTPLPAIPIITPSGPVTFCSGDSVLLTAPAGFGYLWSNGAVGQSIVARNSGTYTVQTLAGGCTSAASASVAVTVNSLPGTPVISFAGGQLHAGITGTSFAWYFNTNLLPALTGSSIPSQGNGVYTVKVTDANGCTSAMSAPYLITGLAVSGHSLPLQVVPNPAGNYFRIIGLTGVQPFELYNLPGQKVHSGTADTDARIDLSHLSPGVYAVRIAGSVLKLVKE